MLMVTTDLIAGWEITAHLGVVMGVSTHPLSPFETGIKTLGTYDRDPKGGTVPMEQLSLILYRMRASALRELQAKAVQTGANAVVSVRFDHRQVTPVWVELCAYGTAVAVAPLHPANP